ncbi:MAG: SH3 domain-containing protein [Anaerolineae bacterium]|nr:SH3 domain-containing protein [Anaerolineae bacterium]
MMIKKQSILRFIRFMLITAAVLAISLPLATAFASSTEAQETVQARATWNLRVRSGPGTDYEQIGTVYKDDTVPVLGRNEAATWVLIDNNGTQGWIAAAYCTFTGDLLSVPINANYSPSSVTTDPPPAAGTAPASGEPASSVIAKPIYDMNLRTGPGTNYERSTVVPAGSVTYVLFQHTVGDKVWLYVEYEDSRGWLASWYVTLTGNLVEVPQADLNTTITSQQSVVTPPPPTPIPPAVVSAPGAYSAPLSRVGANVRSIFTRGQQTGKRANAFTTVGDCETASPDFLKPFDNGVYELYGYDYLEVVINWFSGSFGHTGQAAKEGFPVWAILDPLWANPNACLPDENPLACEYRTWQPAFALIMVRTAEYENGPGSDYYYDVKEVIEFSVSQGVVPILSTLPFQAGAHPHVDSMNESIRLLAQEQNVPLWDFHMTTESLPSRGVDMTYHLTLPDRESPTHFTDTSLRAGMTRRNLEALEVLHAVMSNTIW